MNDRSHSQCKEHNRKSLYIAKCMILFLIQWQWGRGEVSKAGFGGAVADGGAANCPSTLNPQPASAPLNQERRFISLPFDDTR
jgi:hypothetical protein